MTQFDLIETEIIKHPEEGSDVQIAVVTLNRPKALNALSADLLEQLCTNLEILDQATGIGAIIVTGNERVFAAGADIKAMAAATPMDMVQKDSLRFWKQLRAIKKPLLAAVSGFAFGGGCELAMTCDLIIASETAVFGQPEIKLGIIPGAGGTQRLAKAMGPYRAMEMVLTGEPLTAQQAFDFGLVNRVIPVEQYLEAAKELAFRIASRPPLAVRLAKEAVRSGVETTLREGLEVERRNYYLTYDTDDQKEGMRAFIEKRKPNFNGS